jgi:hypothetical protein
MSRLLKLGTLAMLCSAGLLIGLMVNPRRQPSTLFIDVQSLDWQTVIVESADLPLPVHFEKGNAALAVSPIEHGVYRIGVQLSNGKAIWCEFFHHDTGVRRRIDVVVTSSPDGFYFRQTANQSTVLFDGEARPGNATEQTPFRLDWMCSRSGGLRASPQPLFNGLVSVLVHRFVTELAA